MFQEHHLQQLLQQNYPDILLEVFSAMKTWLEQFLRASEQQHSQLQLLLSLDQQITLQTKDVNALILIIENILFLSDIVEEGKMTSFLLGSLGVLSLRHSIMRKKMILEVTKNYDFVHIFFFSLFIFSCSQATTFILIISILRFTIELNLSKQGSNEVLDSKMYVADVAPLLPLIILAYMLYKSIASCKLVLKLVITGSIFSYILVALHWILESNLSNMTHPIYDVIKGNVIPRVIYIMGITQLLSLVVFRFFEEVERAKWGETTMMKGVAMLSTWSSTLMILSGRQGPWIALALVVGGTP